VIKQRFVVCVVAACVVAWLANSSTTMSAQAAKPPDNCRRGISDRDPLLYGGEMRDGFLHLRIAYDHDVEPEHRKAFQGAMALWNAHSEKTGVVFENATSPVIDLRLQRGSPIYVKGEDPDKDISKIDRAKIAKAEETKCAEYVSRGPYIWYSRKMMYWMNQPSDWPNRSVEDLLASDDKFVGMARIYAHELGHALNIDHKSGNSVMREDKTRKCQELGMSILADIQPEDVRDAERCACHVRANLRAPGFIRRPYPDPPW